MVPNGDLLSYPYTHDSFLYSYDNLSHNSDPVLFWVRGHNEWYKLLDRAGEGISEPLSDILYNMLSDELFKHPATQTESLILSCRKTVDRQLLTVKEATLIAFYNYTRWRQLVNHSGISGQETMALFRNAIDMQLRLRLDLHSPVNVELP